jgi:hypothetical protein
LLSVAYLNAYSATRVLATRVITCAGEATSMCAHVTCETNHSHVLCYYWTNSVLQAEITHYPLLLLLLQGLGSHAPIKPNCQSFDVASPVLSVQLRCPHHATFHPPPPCPTPPIRQAPPTHLEALHNSLDHLVLQPTVLPLSVLPDGHQVDVVILGLVAREAEARPHIGIQV